MVNSKEWGLHIQSYLVLSIALNAREYLSILCFLRDSSYLYGYISHHGKDNNLCNSKTYSSNSL